MAAYWPELEPLFAPVPDVSSELWVITHEDLARNARVRALVAHLVEAAKAWRPYFLGTGTTHPPPAAVG
jgi:DNA-binding transcriptional LysR family regulator